MWIVVFDMTRVPEFTGRGFGCFPKCLGTRTLYLGQRGKPTRFLESAKGSFAESRGQTPGFPASGPRRQGPWRLRKTSFCTFQKTSWAFPFGLDKVFLCPNISGNIRNPFRWIPEPFRRSNTTIHISIFTSGPFRSSSSYP